MITFLCIMLFIEIWIIAGLVYMVLNLFNARQSPWYANVLMFPLLLLAIIFVLN